MSERTTPPGGRSEPIETALPIESTSKTNRSPEFSTPTTSAPLAPVPTESKATSYRAQQPSHVQPTRSGRPVARERVTDLLAKKDFTEIAKLLMPDEMMGSQQDQIWVTRLVMRIMAAADGIAQVFPNSSEQARQLHDALRNRHRQYTSRLHLNPTFLAMNAGNTGSSATRWRILLEETDDLLGAIAYQSVDSDQATLRLHAVIEKVAAQVEIAMRGE